MASAKESRRVGIVHIRDDQIASINPALERARQDKAAGVLDAFYPMYVLDDETIAETRPSLCRLHYLFFRLWRLGERVREAGSRLEFRQGDFAYELKQYAAELGASRIYTTTNDTVLGVAQMERIRRGLAPLELVEVPAKPAIMTEEHEDFVPYWELFSEDELEAMSL